MNWRYRHTVLALCTLAFMATMVARLAISPVVPLIVADFGVSNAAIGLSLSLMWGAYALTQFPSGVLGDRFGERRVVLTAVGVTALASLLLAAATGPLVFAAVTVLLGAGAGLHYSAATTLLTRHFDDIGRAIGVHVAGAPVAGLLAPPVAAAVGLRYGWRPALLLGAAVAVPVAAVFAWRVRPTGPARPDQPMRERFELGPVVALLSRPSIAFTTVLAFLGAFTWQATASFLPAFLDLGRGLSTALAGLLFSAYFVVQGTTQPLMGGLSDRFGRDAVVTLAMGIGVVGYATLVVADSLAGYAVAVVLVGLAMSWGPPLQSRFIDALSATERGAGFGLVRTVYMLLGASGSVVVGALSDVAGWSAAFGLLAGVMALAVALLVGNRALGLGL